MSGAPFDLDRLAHQLRPLPRHPLLRLLASEWRHTYGSLRRDGARRRTAARAMAGQLAVGLRDLPAALAERKATA